MGDATYNLPPQSTGLPVKFTGPAGNQQVITLALADGTELSVSDIEGLPVSSEPATVCYGSTADGAHHAVTTGLAQTFTVGAGPTTDSDIIDVSRFRKFRLGLNGGTGLTARIIMGTTGYGIFDLGVSCPNGNVISGDVIAQSLQVRIANGTGSAVSGVTWYLWLSR